jgi:hypothetical protein
MKTAGLFYFADEPQFSTTASREYLAHRLKCWRNARGNMGKKIYQVTRTGFGRYTVQLQYPGSPVAVIVTH